MCIHEGREGLYLDSPKNRLTSSKARGCFSGITYSYLPIFGDTPCGGDIVYFPTLALVSAPIMPCLLHCVCCSIYSYHPNPTIHSCRSISFIIFPSLNKKIGMSVLRSRPKSGTANQNGTAQSFRTIDLS